MIEANGSALRAKYDDFYENVSGVPVSRAGNHPSGTPQRLANLWVAWDFAPGWKAIGNLAYNGGLYANTANTVRLPAYTVAGLGLRWAIARDTTLDLRARNIFDKVYAYTAGGSGTLRLLGEPRAFYATLTTKF